MQGSNFGYQRSQANSFRLGGQPIVAFVIEAAPAPAPACGPQYTYNSNVINLPPRGNTSICCPHYIVTIVSSYRRRQLGYSVTY